MLKSDSATEKGLAVISKENISSRYSDLTEALARHYSRVRVLSDEILAEVVFGEEVVLTKEVEDLVVYSVFTNNVEEPILDETTFPPETNIQSSGGNKKFDAEADTTIELLAGVGDNNIGVVMENFYFQQCRTPRGVLSPGLKRQATELKSDNRTQKNCSLPQ